MSSVERRRRSRGNWITPIAELADIRSIPEALAFVAFWPCIVLIAWMAIDPYSFREVLIRLLEVMR